ncbi:uncharacterized protein F4812DRAFT_421546 [Daldinia caldariorum]|uniref:uncharacterized protein n=1 Tax=Daldinia caldariorum TaxID=326644 RepID=UPI002008CA2F|nr:uncharacterized protein F4812DRAFT_421546 [Daldinia caldariorum]KAI1470107.1 hypothetical protein F4812DRAFT_421546 [Daldinia caldariorum]
MSPSHRPDLALYRNPVPAEKMDITPFMWPDINLEDLSKRDSLLRMIHSRGNFLPAQFAYRDSKSIRLGYNASYFTPVSLPGYDMSFEGVTEPSRYGQLYDNSNDHVKFEDYAARGFYGPDVGFRVLVVQDRIYYFLVKVCEEIVRDISAGVLLNGRPPLRGLSTIFSTVLPTRRFFAKDKFADLYKCRLDATFACTGPIIRSMLFAAEGHFKALREDPDYFRAILIETEEHCPGHLSDVNGREHPCVKDHNVYCARTIRQVISDAFSTVCALAATYNGFRFLNNSFNEWQANSSRTATLPLRICKTLYGLYYSMTRVGQNVIRYLHLLEGICSSPPLREYFCHTFQDPSAHDALGIRRRPRVSMTEDCADVVYFLENIASESEAGPLSSEEFLTELDLLVRRNPKAKSFISGWVSTHLSILGLVCECLTVLDKYQPWILGRVRYRREYPGEVEDFYETEFAYPFTVYDIPDSFWMSTVQSVRGLLIRESKYPVREPCSEEAAKELRRTEEDMDQFWDKVLAQLKIVGASEASIRRVFRRGPQRVAIWVEQATGRAERKKMEEGEGIEPELKRTEAQAQANAKMMGKNKRINGLSNGTVTYRYQINVDSKEVISRSEEADTEIKGPEVEDETPLFEVDTRTFKVFMTLLSDGTDPSSLAEVFWDDIVHAMVGLGFTATKLFFSAWMFQRSDPKLEFECIMLQEPYSAEKLDHATVRHFGRHIFWTFGWKCSMFAQAL